MTTLLGFDVFAILMALLKMTNDWVALGEKANKYLGGLIMAFSVGIVGYHSINPLFTETQEPHVVLVLTVVTAFLTAVGFGPGVVGTIKSVHALVRFRALEASGAEAADLERLADQLKEALRRVESENCCESQG